MDWIGEVVAPLIVGLILAITGFFAKSIWNFLTDRLLTVFRPKHFADVRGQWKSTFTWQDGSDEDQATDNLEVKQTGRSVSGKTITGDYRYKFKGRFVDRTLLVGEWEGLTGVLLGTFLLSVDAETGDVSGYWIGNGTEGLCHGKWTWQKPK